MEHAGRTCWFVVKIFARSPIVRIALTCIVATCALLGALDNSSVVVHHGAWRQAVQEGVSKSNTWLVTAATERFPPSEIASTKYALHLDELRLTYGAAPISWDSATEAARIAFGGLTTPGGFLFLAMIVSWMAGASVAAERQDGTLRTLVSRPGGRWAILAGKLLVVLMMSVVLLLVAWMAVFGVLGWRDGGWNGLNQRVLVARQLGPLIPANLSVMRGWEYVLSYILVLLPSMTFFIALGMIPSVLSRRAADAVLVSMGVGLVMVLVPHILNISGSGGPAWLAFTPLSHLSAENLLVSPGPPQPGRMVAMPTYGANAAWPSTMLMLGWGGAFFLGAGVLFVKSDIW